MLAVAVIEMVKINNGGRPVAAQERAAVNLLRATEPGRPETGDDRLWSTQLGQWTFYKANLVSAYPGGMSQRVLSRFN